MEVLGEVRMTSNSYSFLAFIQIIAHYMAKNHTLGDTIICFKDFELTTTKIAEGPENQNTYGGP